MMPIKNHRIPYAVFRALPLAALFCANSLFAAWQDSLTEQEIESLSTRAKQQFPTARLSTKGINADTKPGVEILLVEIQENKSRKLHEAKLAEVFIFDYSTATASVQLINVDTHELISTRPIENIHLPLNQRETRVAKQILNNDVRFIDGLKSEYLAQFGQPLSSLALLDMKVSIWDRPSNQVDGSICDRTRCALVSVFTHNHYNFSIEPVVELRDGTVHLDLLQ